MRMQSVKKLPIGYRKLFLSNWTIHFLQEKEKESKEIEAEVPVFRR